MNYWMIGWETGMFSSEEVCDLAERYFPDSIEVTNPISENGFNAIAIETYKEMDQQFMSELKKLNPNARLYFLGLMGGFKEPFTYFIYENGEIHSLLNGVIDDEELWLPDVLYPFCKFGSFFVTP